MQRQRHLRGRLVGQLRAPDLLRRSVRALHRRRRVRGQPVLQRRGPVRRQEGQRRRGRWRQRVHEHLLRPTASAATRVHRHLPGVHRRQEGRGADGACGTIAAGSDPDNECAAQAPSTCGTTGACNGSGRARSTHRARPARPPRAPAPPPREPPAATAPAPAWPAGDDCAPYICLAGACDACTGDAECTGTQYCGGARAWPRRPTAPPAPRPRCTSTVADGVCCNVACAGLCSACTAAKKGGGADGACGSIAAGTDPDGECAEQGANSCGTDGAGDGAGACRSTPAARPARPRPAPTERPLPRRPATAPAPA